MMLRKLKNYLLWILVPFLLSCSVSPTNLPVEIALDYNWEFSKVNTDEWLLATVPGTVHADLLANGLITDPHYRLNEDDLQWVENEKWQYRTYFHGSEYLLNKNNILLQFEGLDTYASVFLNDSLVLVSDNMNVGFKIYIKNIIKPGPNELKVIFDSPVEAGMEKLKQVNYTIPAVNEQAPYDQRTNVFTRKAPFHYGWDWGPRLVTSGIWRHVTIKAWDSAIIDDIYVHTKQIEKKQAKLNVSATINVYMPGNYRLGLLVDGKTLWQKSDIALSQGENVIEHDFVIDNPRLWWSNGLGKPHLYDFTFTLSNDTGKVDQILIPFGIRTLKLVQEPDNKGRSFYFELNGFPVFMKGANVIPSNTLTPSVTFETYQRLIADAVNANMNMLRVWGGAIYEEDIFYELCDRNGILVWQDFMFACALQPGDEAHLDNIKLEAEYNVKRLRNHPSIALWCGNNENLHGWHHWGWKTMYEPEVRDYMWRTYERIFYEILPVTVKKLTANTPYWSSSPSSFTNRLADRRSGDEHDWTIWFGQRPFSDFGVNVPRFVSEYGLQSFPNMHTIKEFSLEEDWDIDSEVMNHRQRGRMEYMGAGFNGNHLIKRYMEQYYPVPENFEQFTYVSQLLQAKAYQEALEAHRRNMPHCMGSLYWQLNDSWPTISWSTVDWYGRWKAAHYAVRKANAPVMIAPQYIDGNLLANVVNDNLNAFNNAKIYVSFIDFDGEEISSFEKAIKIEANTSTLVLNRNIEDIIQGSNLASTVALLKVFNADSLLAENLLYFFEPKDLQLKSADIVIDANRNNKGYAISLTSDKLVKNIYIDTPYPDDFLSDNYFDLVPNQTKTIQFATKHTIDVATDISYMTLNDIQ